MTTSDLHEDDPIQALIDAGDYRAAARECETLGLFAQAQLLYERLFDYERAGELAERQRDDIRALELYLKGNHIQAAEAVRRRLMAELSDEIPRALKHFEERGYFLQAAELAESIGNLEQAARLYTEGNTHDRAAAIFERIGRLRKAGESYEKFLQGDPDDAFANLGLGRVLQRFGRHKEAIPLLSASTHYPRTLDEAGQRIACSFFKLQFLEAGRTSLERIGEDRNVDPQSFMRPFEDELNQGPNADAPNAPSTNTALEGRYRIEQPLGGRIGATYAARDLLRSKRVTLRFYPGSPTDNTDFYDELRRLQNPHIAGLLRILEIHNEGGFVAYEWVNGPSLLEALQSKKPPTAMQCKAFAVSILDAISAAHRRGILHGALTPSSIRLGVGGVCLVDDWGMHLLEKRMATQTGGPDSPFSYRAPELNIGRGADARADLYSVAAILYRALVGTAPPLGRAGDAFADWPQGFASFFTSALHPQPDQRPPSGDLFRRTLLSLPWNAVGARRVKTSTPSIHTNNTAPEGPRLTFEDGAPPPQGSVVKVHDTLLKRDILFLQLPPEDDRPLHLVDRLHVFASPECPVFQDLLRMDDKHNAILFEIPSTPYLSTHLKETSSPTDVETLLDLSLSLLNALSIAHQANIGLGTLTPHSVRFDGLNFRVSIAETLLTPSTENTRAMQQDAEAFIQIIASCVLEHIDLSVTSPALFLDVLLREKYLAPADVRVLRESAPETLLTLAGFTEWFSDLQVAVESHISKTLYFKRLVEFVHTKRTPSARELDFLEQRRRALNLPPEAMHPEAD